MTSQPTRLSNQSGVIPYRRRGGALEVLLITSSDGRRWGIPKGVIEHGMTPAESAAWEAYEEAGIRGRVHPQSVGQFHYRKWGGTFRVEVFLMEVTEELADWPERRLRRREWMGLRDAPARISRSELRTLVQAALQALRE